MVNHSDIEKTDTCVLMLSQFFSCVIVLITFVTLMAPHFLVRGRIMDRGVK